MKRVALAVATGILIIGFSATGALAFHCPKLIAAGKRLAGKSMVDTKAKASILLDEAMALHKSGNHKSSMQKATQAVDILTR